MTIYNTKKEALENASGQAVVRIDGGYRDGKRRYAWAVMSWSDFYNWENQR